MSANVSSISNGQSFNWPVTLVMALFHIGALAALFVFNWHLLAAGIFLYWLATGLGISMGYHRLLTHRSYKVPLLLEYFFTVCGTLTLEGGPISWVATHRIHHQSADRPGDPHSPRDGALWAHAGWLLSGEANNSNTRKMSKYAPDFGKAPLLCLVEQLPLGSGGCARDVAIRDRRLSASALGHLPPGRLRPPSTWLVNSATHMWGSRRFKTHDDSRNNWWVAYLTFGEGWHNNHHAHPSSARHGLAWYEFDPSWIQIKLLKIFHIARWIREAKISIGRDEPTLADTSVC